MMAELTEEQEIAEALLATVRHKLTGREEAICERIANGESVDDPVTVFDEDGDVCGYRDDESFAGYPTPDEQPLFDSMCNQFAREIAAWKDGVRA